MTFDFYSFRFEFEALDSIRFPAGSPANTLRGALGTVFRKVACAPECPGFAGRSVRECGLRETCAYARIFEPSSVGNSPSGLADWPRPFVFRASHLDGCAFSPGERFWFDVNLFHLLDPPLRHFVLAFQQLAQEGLGAGRGRADLVSIQQVDGQRGTETVQVPGPPISISLEAGSAGVHQMRVEFVTPTELKSGAQLVARPEFGALFARARDRVSTLRALYGAGPLEIDFRGLGERALEVRLTRCDLTQAQAARRSSRTGQVHGLGGFVGVAEYEGALDEFIPYLEAARWTGVGRHCVWGNGELRVIIQG